ncbi:universal stress protein [Streptomyces sp. NPDC017979]|uniref:universal stress protein n=1 Tax=Streptomyces sp. NPDC017979 TaxID=3365024 RepID=UPI0037A8F87F
MVRAVTVGLDGSRESLAAAEWGAREAELRKAPLRLVNVWPPDGVVPQSMADRAGQRHWAERVPRHAAEELRGRHPGLDVAADQLVGWPREVLPEAAAAAELLVLGSRGLSGVGRFLVGAVGQAVLAQTDRPVVFVRAPEHGHVPPDARGPVVLGLDTAADPLLEFAFEEARRRGTGLWIVHAWNLPPYFGYGMPPDSSLNADLTASEAAKLEDGVRPWRKTYPGVEVTEDSKRGRTVDLLADVARDQDAALVVVGRRIRRSSLGGRVGAVTYGVLHHVAAPVAVVSHA